MSGWMLGIDFGTSNTAAAHTGVSTGTAETLPLTHQGNLMSSAVFVESPDSIDVGDVALNKAETNPAAFVPAPKRQIGSPIMHVNGYDIPPALAVAAVLHSVLSRANAAHRDQRPHRLVLTHPEGWSPREIGVLIDAAARIGFGHHHVTTVSEPRAAAHYYSRTETMAPGAKIAVFDFGGGTLDIAVLTATEHGTFEVIAARGDNALGGKNLDALLRGWVDDQLSDRNPALLDFIRSGAPAHVHRNLDDSIRRAKELLSSTPSATITVVAKGQQETLTVTRTEFDALIAPTVEQATHMAGQTLRDAGIRSPHELSALYLTGGSSRIPLVHTHLAPLGPIATLDDPKTVVAQGALIAAAAASHPAVQAPSAYTAQLTGQYPQSQAWPDRPLFTPQIRPREQLRDDSTSNPTARTGFRRVSVIAGAAATVVLLAAVAAIGFTGGFTTPAESAAAQSPVAAETPAATTAPSGPADSVEAIEARLPAALAEVITSCERQTFVMDVLQAKCTVDPDNSLADLFGQYSEYFSVSIDPKNAKKALIGFESYQIPNTTFTANAAGTAGVNISELNNYVSANYVNKESGVMLTLYGMRTAADALTFLKATGLL
ncbi:MULTISPECIES: Hsp70 family protein [unclassified Rhodococcus (in: high G+C Gram-positive bacteria)]|uniref:Hsp70 family protein n=1 Tax=unclassified Rhodococcus (in: high G+C Gram-positive bacteria) TaxID=192944 RepID=UPI003391EAFF